MDSLFKGCVDLLWCDLAWVPGCFVVGADGKVLVHGVRHNVGNSTGQGFDGASDIASAMVADALPPLSILLVRDP